MLCIKKIKHITQLQIQISFQAKHFSYSKNKLTHTLMLLESIIRKINFRKYECSRFMETRSLFGIATAVLSAAYNFFPSLSPQPLIQNPLWIFHLKAANLGAFMPEYYLGSILKSFHCRMQFIYARFSYNLGFHNESNSFSIKWTLQQVYSNVLNKNCVFSWKFLQWHCNAFI